MRSPIPRPARRAAIAAVSLLLCLIPAGPVLATTFHVRSDGVDSDERDGRSEAGAWASPAYALSRLPAETGLRLQIGPGTYVIEATLELPDGLELRGHGHEGDSRTILLAADDWPLGEDSLPRENPVNEYLISAHRTEGIAVTDLVLASTEDHRITGAVYMRDLKGLELARLHVHDFRWAGLHVTHSSDVRIHHCLIERASMERHGWTNGLIRTTWIKDSRIHHNVIRSGGPEGYGYKGGGHENVRIHNNLIDAPYFAIESAHENEYGLEIDHNILHGCISVPKGGPSDDPNSRGFGFTVWIHHNLLSDRYTVEGPRNHLRLSHNWIRIERPNGRVYTHHGGTNHGPVWIHHNVVENLDRAFVWMNEGLAEGIEVHNNTVICADADDRAGSVFGSWSGERMNGWAARNNVIVAAPEQPRRLIDTERGVPDKVAMSHNLMHGLVDPPGSAGTVAAPEFDDAGGDDPWQRYRPRAGGNLDRAGVDVGLPFAGEAPSIGAFEAGADSWWNPRAIGPEAPGEAPDEG